eukprot:TRINITY_DN12239_c0_g1_i1.p1 TRINITY_DN12239_c0_g1~~TRINITY_DN12239_c0_g1_i1.p1  ORF type:complete len:372 (-),score=77.32 TRINITY_DN12239_c0_g1_i1:176-1291(-)
MMYVCFLCLVALVASCPIDPCLESYVTCVNDATTDDFLLGCVDEARSCLGSCTDEDLAPLCDNPKNLESESLCELLRVNYEVQPEQTDQVPRVLETSEPSEVQPTQAPSGELLYYGLPREVLEPAIGPLVEQQVVAETTEESAISNEPLPVDPSPIEKTGVAPDPAESSPENFPSVKEKNVEPDLAQSSTPENSVDVEKTSTEKSVEPDPTKGPSGNDSRFVVSQTSTETGSVQDQPDSSTNPKSSKQSKPTTRSGKSRSSSDRKETTRFKENKLRYQEERDIKIRGRDSRDHEEPKYESKMERKNYERRYKYNEDDEDDERDDDDDNERGDDDDNERDDDHLSRKYWERRFRTIRNKRYSAGECRFGRCD